MSEIHGQILNRKKIPDWLDFFIYLNFDSLLL